MISVKFYSHCNNGENNSFILKDSSKSIFKMQLNPSSEREIFSISAL